ncbi:MAG: PilX N-terminal domain-containing pilus assembly protein [Nitrospirota bacterium]
MKINRKRKIESAITSSESGFALIIVMLVLVMMTVLGLNAIMTSSTDIQISGNEKVAVRALSVAEAGLNHGMRRLRGQTFDTLLAGLVDETSKYSLINSTIFDGGTYKVYLRNNYPSDVGDAGMNMYNSDGDDMIIIRSEATYNDVTKVIESKVERIAADFPVVAGLGIAGAVEEFEVNDSSVRISGIDTTPTDGNTWTSTSCSNKSGIAVEDDAAQTTIETAITNGKVKCNTSPASQTTITGAGGSSCAAAVDVNTTSLGDLSAITATATELMQYADRTITVEDDNVTMSNISWGTFDNPQITVVDFKNTTGERELRIQGNSTGYGILIVNAASTEGSELDLRGNFDWYGVIILTNYGEADLDNGGNINIYGGLLLANSGDGDADSEVELKGNVSIYYSCAAEQRAENYSALKVQSWHEIKS